MQAILGVGGSWLLAFGIVHTVKVLGMDAFDTSRPSHKTSKFWFGLVLITLAGLPPVVKWFWPCAV